MPTTPDDVTQAVLDAAVAPRKATGDSGSVEQHSIPDLIAADKYARANDTSVNPIKKLRMVQIVSPGGTGV